jgi:NADH-quinone oxidoreductase subunit F
LRAELLPALHAAHDAEGWLSPEALDDIAFRLGLGRAEVHGVASFYGSFALEPRSPRVRRICTDIVCAAAGAVAPTSAVATGAGAEATGPAAVVAPCLGRCEQAPATLTTDHGQALAAPAPPPVDPPADSRTLLRRVGVADPADLDDYLAHGGY